MDTLIQFLELIKCYLLALVIGAFVGLSELLSRYTWTLRSVMASAAGLSYLGLNGIAAMFAYFAAVQWNFHAGLEGKSEFWRVLVISSLAMAALRSSFINLQIGNRQFGAGFASILEIFMHRAERVLDQKLVKDRWGKVAPIIEGLTYRATKTYLAAVSEMALRSLSAQENNILQQDLAKIDVLEVEDGIKMQLFAMRIVEKTSLELFISFAETARIKLAVENERVNEEKVNKMQRLKDAKKLLA